MFHKNMTIILAAGTLCLTWQRHFLNHLLSPGESS